MRPVANMKMVRVADHIDEIRNAVGRGFVEADNRPVQLQMAIDNAQSDAVAVYFCMLPMDILRRYGRVIDVDENRIV